MYIDIRSQDKYNAGHINGAINIQGYQLVSNPSMYLSKNEKYYIYCDNGIRSRQIVSWLRKKGYNCVNIDGGYNNYLFN